MLLGIDYGTTHTVVAAADRGNYPVVSFHDEQGDTQQWYPSVIAARGEELRFGLDAVARAGEEGWTTLRSFKRELASLAPASEVALGEQSFPALDLLAGFLTQLRRDLRERSNLRLKPQESLEAMISVPANANSTQRFLTMEAFRRAGFAVRGMINEPSAAGIEFAHHHLSKGRYARREFVIVYDLGGGTFDASVIKIIDQQHEVVSTEGIARLGGDDFDEILLAMALRQAGIESLSAAGRQRLLEECREKKEGLHPNTRKIAIDLGRVAEDAGEVIVSTAGFYEHCQPLMEETMEALARVMERSPGEAELDWRLVAAIYLVGGSSDLPVVPRLLRARYTQQVLKSPYPHAATAIGLAIAADGEAGYRLRERFTRHFGVWREAADGRAIIFDTLFAKDTLLPERGGEKLTLARRYTPAHNIGHFRYLECSRTDERGQPKGDLTPWQEIYFPFAPELQDEAQLANVPVVRAELGGQLIEEIYSCDEHGIIEVEIANRTTGYGRRYTVGSVAGEEARFKKLLKQSAG